jgi:hypothetical protein
MPSGLSSMITCDGFSSPLRRAISIGITSVALNFPVRNVFVTSLICHITSSLTIIRYINTTTCDAYMTNVYGENFRRMIEFKQRESRDNLEIAFDCLNKFDNPASVLDVFKLLSKISLDKAKREAQEKYERGEIDRSKIDDEIRKNNKIMSKRTIERAFKTLVVYGSVQKNANKYSITKKGERELMFKQFAQGYGNMSLNGLMDLTFPTLNTLDKNLHKLVEIFGVYVIYALQEATRLIVAYRSGQEEHWHSSYFGDVSNFKDGKFREGQLVNSWIKDVFNPWYMLNIFLAAVSNSDERKGSEDNTKKEKTLIEQRIKQYKNENLPQIIDVDSIRNMHRSSKIIPSTLDLMFKRISEVSENSGNKSQSIDIISERFHPIKIRSHYSGDTLLYEPDSEEIEKLKNSLKKQYPLYFERLQKIDESFYSK